MEGNIHQVKRKLGIDQGKIWIADDFDAPSPELIFWISIFLSGLASVGRTVPHICCG